MKTIRYLAILGAVGVLGHAAFDIVRTTSADGALTCFLALATIGTLLSRLSQAPFIAFGAGVVATGAAGLGLLKGDESPLLAIAYLGASLVLLVTAGLLLQAARPNAPGVSRGNGES